MENKQTAVDWLFEQLWETPKDKFEWHAILAKAKEMEKEQQRDLIRFLRTEDKMGKSVQDLLTQFNNKK